MHKDPRSLVGIGLVVAILGVGLLGNVFLMRLDRAQIHQAEWEQVQQTLNQLVAERNDTGVVRAATPSTTAPSSTDVPITGKIGLNTASAAELDALPGIGSVRAQAIVDERTARGAFTDLDDLHSRVTKIPTSVLQDISQLITF